MLRDAPLPAARAVARALAVARIPLETEDAAQAAALRALEAAGIGARREVRLGPKDRVDLLTDAGVAVELKIAGGARGVFRQLERYAAHPEVVALVIASTRGRPGSVTTVGGKPLEHVSLARGWL
jgi:hypothetical protein